MRLLDNLRNTEHKGVKAVRRGIERAREEWGDMERRIRQRMRIYPQKLKNVDASRSEYEPEAGIVDEGIPAGIGEPVEPEPTKPIISIHGKDVKDGDLDKPTAA